MINSPCYLTWFAQERRNLTKDRLTNHRSETHCQRRSRQLIPRSGSKKNLLPIDFNATYYPNTENTCTCIRPQQINPPLTRHVLSTCIQTDQSTYSGYNTRLLANRVRPPCDDADWIQIICKSFGRTVVWKRWCGPSLDACEPVVNR